MTNQLQPYKFDIFVFLISSIVLLWRAPTLASFLQNSDHGYQLSMGKQILLGKFPFVDLFFHYGPLTAFTSAFGLWISDSLIPEIIICAIGYAAAIFLIYFLTRQYSSTRIGIFAALAGLLLLSRFYKWYYWLFPLLVLFCFQQFLQARLNQQRYWLYGSGFVSAIAALYRLDLGIACFCFFAVNLLSLSLKPFNPKHYSWQLGLFSLGFVLPLLVWIITLVSHGGNIQDYMSSTFTGAKGAVNELSLPIPAFDWKHPFSLESSTAIAYWMIPLTYLACIAIGIWQVYREPKQRVHKYQFMTAVGVLGLGVFPQALHRADVQHLLQVLPPFLIAAGLLVCELWMSNLQFSRKSRQGVLRGITVLYLGLLITVGWGIREFGAQDLTEWNWNVISRYQQLYQGIHAKTDYPLAKLMLEVQNQTKADESVLTPSWASQFYYFSDRPLSGLLNVYASGILDTDQWRKRNLKAVQADPPTIVIAPSSFFEPTVTDYFHQSQPELYNFLRSDYTQVVYKRDYWMILKHADIEEQRPGK
jgi:4-amino-4-deoxy-L-arabinose transferase-like glycosyltransferase